jgi:DNA-binding NarL/FixJ family response regulator
MWDASGLAHDEVEVVVLFSDPAVRARVRQGLERHGYRVVQPERLLEWVTSRRPHVLVVAGDDERATRARTAVSRLAPEAACVVLTDDPAPGRYRELLATSTAVLPVSASEDDVAVAVAGAWRDLTCLPAAAARTLTGEAAGAAPVTLTPREVAWLRSLADGTTVAGLARSAGYSSREMYRLLAALYTRLGTTNRTEALLRADRYGLLAVGAPGQGAGSSGGPAGPGVPDGPSGPGGSGGTRGAEAGVPQQHRSVGP